MQWYDYYLWFLWIVIPLSWLATSYSVDKPRAPLGCGTAILSIALSAITMVCLFLKLTES